MVGRQVDRQIDTDKGIDGQMQIGSQILIRKWIDRWIGRQTLVREQVDRDRQVDWQIDTNEGIGRKKQIDRQREKVREKIDKDRQVDRH